MPTTNRATLAFGTVTTLFFAWGFITSNNDPLIAAMRAIFALSYTEALLTQFAFFIAFGLVSLPAAVLLSRVGPVRAIVAALGTMLAACVVAMGAAQLEAYWLVLAGLFLMAGGITALQVAANPLAAALGNPERSHFRLTLAQAFNSLGVVCGVHFGSQIMLSDEIFVGTAGTIGDPAQRAAALAAVEHAYLLIACFVAALIVFVLALRRPLERAQPAVAVAEGSLFGALRDRWALFGAIAIFVYVGAEVAIASLMINFLNQPNILGLPLDTAGAYLANFYWGGALAGRFIGSWLLYRIAAPRLLSAAAISACALCIAVTVAGGPAAAYAALAVGLFNSILFPTIFTLTLERSAASQAAVSGLLCTAIVGGAVLPLAAGKLADATSLQTAFVIPAIAYIIIVAFGVAASSQRERRAAIMPATGH